MNHFYNQQDSLNGGSARRKASTYTGQHKTNTNIQAVSGTVTHDPSDPATKANASDRAATGTGSFNSLQKILSALSPNTLLYTLFKTFWI
jgi:hypothetical protein